MQRRTESLNERALESDEHHLPAVIMAHERIVGERFWPKVRRLAGHIPFMDDLVAAYYCAMDSRTPARVRGVLLAALVYFILPTDAIPDFIAGLGFTDDATVIATALGIVSGHIKKRHKDKARAFLRKPPEHYDDED